jgi:HK97 gp10 family phage protein
MPDGIKTTVKVDLHGTEEELLAVGPRIAKRLLRRALQAVGEVWKAALRDAVPVDTGALRDSINYKVQTRKSDQAGTVTVGPSFDTNGAETKSEGNSNQSPGVYGMFVEFGLKKKQYKNTPFMRPTFDSSAEAIIDYFAKNLRDDLEAAIKK